jgi:hypothetical protein
MVVELVLGRIPIYKQAILTLIQVTHITVETMAVLVEVGLPKEEAVLVLVVMV